MSKRSSSRDRNPSEAYRHLQPRGTRTMGIVRNGDEPVIPSSTYRTLESTIPAASVRTHTEWNWNQKSGKSSERQVPVDVMNHARHTALGNKNKHHAVTDGERRRFNRDNDIAERDRDGYGGCSLSSSSSSESLSGQSLKRRY